MLHFEHNNYKKNDYLDIKGDCIKQLHMLNNKKTKILQNFIEEIESQKGKDFDVGREFHEKIMPRMSAIGGEISGLTRIVKSELAKYIISVLVDNNKNYFQQFTTMNFIVFSKYFLETSPTNKSILLFLDNSISWKTKNKNNIEFARKSNFINYLDKLEIKKENLEWVKWFNTNYSSYRKLVKDASKEARAKVNVIKKSMV